MLTPALRVKLESVRKLIRRDAKIQLTRLLGKVHPADIATIYKNLSDFDRPRLWNFFPDRETMAKVILELEEMDMIRVMQHLPVETAAELLDEMESDDAAYILRQLPEELQEQLLGSMEDSESLVVEEMLQYDEESAGAVMNTGVFSLHEELSVKEATKLLHKAEHLEMVFYLYVIDDEGCLTGVISLRQLILNPPDKKLRDIMIRDVVSVTVDMDREDVVRVVERYDFLAVPVVDELHHLVGIVTVDDVIDIIREEATEDMYKMAGTSDDEMQAGNNSFRIARMRLPWLLITLLGEMVSGLVIGLFQGKVHDFLVLVTFMPIIMAMGGNVGSQSATIIIRGIALGKIEKRQLLSVLLKEMRVGLLMGLVSGILISIIIPLTHAEVSPYVGLIVGVALFAAMTFASFTGAFVPATLIRFNFDPAVASSPLLSMLNDITGLTIYFTVAMAMMLFV